MNLVSAFFPGLSAFAVPETLPTERKQNKTASILAFITAFIVLNNIVWLTPTLGTAYYAFLGGILLLVLLAAGKVRINIEMILIYLACLCSIWFNDIPAFFKAEYRFVSFAAVTLLVSPALSSNFLAVFRMKLFRCMLQGIVLLALLSFLSRFVGLSKSQGAYWCGVVNHSMTLGPVCGIAFLTVLSDLIVEGKNYSPGKKCRLALVLVAALVCLLGASSRAAIIATVIGSLVVIGAHFKVDQIFKWGVLAITAVALSVPLWTPLWETVMKKNENSETISFSSRATVWEQRLKEFKENPFFGCGFGSVDTDAGSSLFNRESGQVETGSSWLAILSMCGLFGFFSILLLQYNSFVRFVQLPSPKSMILLAGLLFFWYIEMCAEGFIFAAGSFEFFFLWSLFGVFEAVLIVNNKEIY